MRRIPYLLLLVALALALPGTAAAHSGRSVSYSTLKVRGAEVDVGLRLMEEDLIEVLALDANRDGKVSGEELEKGKTLLGDYLRNNLRVHARDEPEDGKPPRLHPCAPLLEKVESPVAGDSRRRFRVKLVYRCGDCQGAPTCGGADRPSACATRPGCGWVASPIRDLAVRVSLFQGTSFTHQHQATARVGGTERVLFFDATTLERNVIVSLWAQVRSYLWHGIHHIWMGYDHLLFLFGLLLLGGSLRTLVKIVTSFTVAHSVTLILAGLNVVTLPGQLVESAIALTIAYIGIENLFLKDTSKRWIVTFLLGLIHGFGFAGALAESGLPTKGFLLTLFTFNVGVEIGQVAVVALLWPLLLWLLKQRWHRKVTTTLSLGIFVFGFVLFVLRAFFEY